MVDISTISGALSSVKTAYDIAKIMQDVIHSYDEAAMKLKIADLMIALADTKSALAEIQEVIKEKDDRIKELEKSFAFKDEIVRYLDVYYKKGEKGEPEGDPFCSNCWEANMKAIHLYSKRSIKVCPQCNTEYSAIRAPLNPEKKT